jgi:hypothetical protein
VVAAATIQGAVLVFASMYLPIGGRITDTMSGIMAAVGNYVSSRVRYLL